MDARYEACGCGTVDCNVGEETEGGEEGVAPTVSPLRFPMRIRNVLRDLTSDGKKLHLKHQNGVWWNNAGDPSISVSKVRTYSHRAPSCLQFHIQVRQLLAVSLE